MREVPYEVLKLEVEELTELLRSGETSSDLRALLAAHDMPLDDYLLGGLIDGEDDSRYGVFVGRDGACTVFDIAGDGELIRWERVDDPESFQRHSFPAINVAIALATATR